MTMKMKDKVNKLLQEIEHHVSETAHVQ